MQHQGQAMVESLVVLPVILLLLLGIIQFGLIYNAKTILNYATFEAARAGALNHADRQAIEFALARGLAGLYTSIEKPASGGNIWDKTKAAYRDVETLKKARMRVLDEDMKDFVCIERINPTGAAFDAYGIKGEIGTYKNQTLIPNDHLLYRSAVVKGAAGVSIQDANLLKLRITYCYPMAVPMVSNVIKKLYGLGQQPSGQPLEAGSFRKNCLKHDRMPIVAQATIRMQTAARNDRFKDSCL
jgi:hypothetical protein